jgi:hypothetical protein
MAVESNIYALWVGKQVAKGTANTAGTKRLIQVAGDIETTRADGAEAFSDLDFYGNQTDFANTLVGSGTPAVEAQSDTLAYLCWLFFGGETFKAAATEAEQELPIVGGTAGGFTITLGQGATFAVSAEIPFGATLAEMQTIITAMPNVKACGGVTLSGGPPKTVAVKFKFASATLGNIVGAYTPNAAGLAAGMTAAAALTVKSAGTYAEHTYIPLSTGGFFSTWFKRLGGSFIIRQKTFDGKIGTLAIEGSTQNKVVRATTTFVGLKPGVMFVEGEEPTGKINLANVPFIYTEGAGNYNIDGFAFHGHTNFNVTWDLALTPVYGDEVVPYDLVPGLAKVTIAASLILDQLAFEEYCRIIYGEAKPGAGKEPLQHLPLMGSYEVHLIKSTGESLKILVPSVHWAPGLSLPPNPSGGVIDLGMTGEMRKQQGSSATTITILNPDNAAYTT